MVLDLEGVADERRFATVLQDNLLFLVLRVQSDVPPVQRGRQIAADGVQEILNTLVLHGRSHQHGTERASQGGSSDGSVNGVLWDVVGLEVNLCKLIVKVCKDLQQLRTHLCHALLERGWNVVDAVRKTLVALEEARLPRDHVAHAHEAVLLANGDLDGLHGEAQLLADLLEHQEGVGPIPVELVDEDHSRDLVALHLSVHRDGLALHAADAAADHDGAVEHAQGSLDLDGEVDVAWGVDEIEVVIGVLRLPRAVGRRRGDGDALLPLELHVIHLRPNAVLASHLVDLLDAASVEEDPLGESRLSTVDVRRDTEVPDVIIGQVCGKGTSHHHRRGQGDHIPPASRAYSQHACHHDVPTPAACHKPPTAKMA
mmetsp:Transcript_19776/g.55772  ORF Transcript_19776/g.55772 Transcript_19776/m.55772 type:complete len:371 (-) Transcript_19776:3-1115(-)